MTSSLDDIDVAVYRDYAYLEGETINFRMLSQKIQVAIYAERLALRDAFKEFVKSRLGVPGASGLNLSDVVRLSEQVTNRHVLGDGIALLYYVFDMTPENCRSEIARLLSISGFKMDYLLDQVHFVIAEDNLNLKRGTICDMSKVYRER